MNVKSLQPIEPTSWNRARLESLIDSFRGKQVLVIGDVGVDRYTVGLVERISPEAPVPIVLVEEEWLKLGLAANVAENIKVLGGNPLLTGVTGADRAGEDFKTLLKKTEIRSTYLVTDEKRRTVLKERLVSGTQQLLRVDYETPGEISPEIKNRVFAEFQAVLPQADAIILEDYSKGGMTHELIANVLQVTKKAGKLALVDPHVNTPAEVYRGADLLTPNKKEAEALSGVKIKDQESLIRAGNRILENVQSKYLVITLGKDGMAIFFADQGMGKVIPTYSKEVYDVSGAGDTVISVLALALSAGADLVEAAVLSNLAAGVEVSKRGTATVSPDEIRQAMAQF